MQSSIALQDTQGFPFRQAINAALETLITQNAGPTEPTPTYVFQPWADTTTGILKQRNAANNDWVEILDLETGRPVGSVAQTSPTGALLLAEGTDTQRPAPEDIPVGVAAVRGNSDNPVDPFIEHFNRHTQKWERVVTSGFALPVLVKADPATPCIIKTSATTLAIKAGTHVKIGSGYVSFVAQTAVVMPAILTPGEDYAVFVHTDGTASAVADPFFAPAAAPAPAPGAVKIGGFHYGLTAPGTTVAGGSFATTGSGMIWTQADVDKIAGVNAFSLWDLSFRPKCDPRGMTRSDAGFWFDIYFCGTEHIANGTSRYNTDVASGTVPPKKPLIFGGNGTSKYTTLTWYEANEIAFSHGKRLMSYQEFSAAAYGVTENQSLGGASSTIPATLRQAGYTSAPGGEQVSGHHYTWGGAAHGVGGSAWVSGAGRGQTYGTPYGALFGGSRDYAANSGSRCSSWSVSAWYSNWAIGLRAACDHYQGAY